MVLATFLTNSLTTSLTAEYRNELSGNKGLILKTGLIISTLLSVFITIIGLFAADYCIKSLNVSVSQEGEALGALKMLVINFGLLALLFPFRTTVIYGEHFARLAIIDFIGVMAKIAGTLFMLITSCWTVVTYFNFMLVGNIFILCLYLGWSKNELQGAKQFTLRVYAKQIKSVFHRMRWLIIGTGLYSLREQGLTLLVNRYVGLEGSGEFGIAKQIFQIGRNLLSTVSTVYMPKVLKSNNMSRVISWANRVHEIIIILFFIISPIVTLKLSDLVAYWIGSEIVALPYWIMLLSINLIIGNYLRMIYPIFLNRSYLKYYEIGINLISILPLFYFWLSRNEHGIDSLLGGYITGDLLSFLLCVLMLSYFFKIKLKLLVYPSIWLMLVCFYALLNGVNFYFQIFMAFVLIARAIKNKLWQKL
jgi:O-antigen/teichoic acid export membrane protein